MTQVNPQSADSRDQTGVPLSHYLWLFRRHQWKILGFVLLCVIVAGVISGRLTRLYEATVTVDIDRQMPSAVVGQDSNPTLTNDSDQFLATQVNLIQSDFVLRPVALQYHLLDSDKDVPKGTSEKATQDAPILLQKLRVSRTRNTYLLLISYRSPDPRLAANVANDIARSYVERTYDIRLRSAVALSSFMEKQLGELKAKMEHSSEALMQFERELNVINPEEKTSILSARLLQLNTEFTNAQTDRVRKESAWKSVQSGSLESAQVSTQGENLKMLSTKLDEARQKFAEVKAHYGENHPEYLKAAAQIDEIQRQLRDARENASRRVAVEYAESVTHEKMLETAVGATKEEFDRLNGHSFEYQDLKRQAEADKTLYEELVRKIKESGINAGFQNSAIRIADPARAAVKPVFPIVWLNLLLAFLLSGLTALGIVVISDLLDKSLRDPQEVPGLFGLEVLGNLPMVKSWRRPLLLRIKKGDRQMVRQTQAGPARRDRSLTDFEEAIRALRNSLLLGGFDRKLKSLMITSPSPAEGKTTAAVYLAIAQAQLKYKTLLIDCHLRHPGVHLKLAIKPEDGLTAVIRDGSSWRDKLVKLAEFSDLDVLAAGEAGQAPATDLPTQRLGILPSRRASDHVGVLLPKILEEAVKEYDLVIIDAPPVLGLPEPLQMAAAVDGILMIVKAGATTRNEVASAMKALRGVNASVVGLVLNSISGDMSENRQYFGFHDNYQRHYKLSKVA